MFKLALALGKDVREIERWPSPLLTEWMAYDLIEPIPDHNWLAGLVAATNVNLWSRKRVDPDDYIPRYRDSRRQSTEEHLALFRGVAAGQDAKAKRGL